MNRFSQVEEGEILNKSELNSNGYKLIDSTIPISSLCSSLIECIVKDSFPFQVNESKKELMSAILGSICKHVSFQSSDMILLRWIMRNYRDACYKGKIAPYKAEYQLIYCLYIIYSIIYDEPRSKKFWTSRTKRPWFEFIEGTMNICFTIRFEFYPTSDQWSEILDELLTIEIPMKMKKMKTLQEPTSKGKKMNALSQYFDQVLQSESTERTENKKNSNQDENDNMKDVVPVIHSSQPDPQPYDSPIIPTTLSQYFEQEEQDIHTFNNITTSTSTSSSSSTSSPVKPIIVTKTELSKLSQRRRTIHNQSKSNNSNNNLNNNNNHNSFIIKSKPKGTTKTSPLKNRIRASSMISDSFSSLSRRNGFKISPKKSNSKKQLYKITPTFQTASYTPLPGGGIRRSKVKSLIGSSPYKNKSIKIGSSIWPTTKKRTKQSPIGTNTKVKIPTADLESIFPTNFPATLRRGRIQLKNCKDSRVDQIFKLRKYSSSIPKRFSEKENVNENQNLKEEDEASSASSETLKLKPIPSFNQSQTSSSNCSQGATTTTTCLSQGPSQSSERGSQRLMVSS